MIVSLLLHTVLISSAAGSLIIGDPPTFDATIKVSMYKHGDAIKDKAVAESFFLLNSPANNTGAKKLPGLINMHGVNTYAEQHAGLTGLWKTGP